LFLGLSSSVSQFGDRLTHMVIITLIGTMMPGKISAFSEFSIAWSLPIILLSPFVGVVVDHYNKQTIMFRCHAVQAVLIFLTPTFIHLTNSIAPIWILVILFFAIDAFNNTAKNAAVPDLVQYHQLVPANSILTTLARVATFFGMVGGGYLVSWMGWRLGFYFDATTHFIAGCLALGMGARALFEPVKKLDFSLRKELKRSLMLFLTDLKELGVLLARDRMVIFVMISVFVLPFVATIAYTVLIFLVQQQFGLGTTGVGWFGGVVGIGMLFGAVLMGFFGERFCRGKIIIFSITVLAAFFIVGPFLVTPFFLYLIAFIAGAVFSFIGISQDTILQEDVMKGIRGRIFATKEFVINLTITISALIIAFISSRLAPYTIIFIVGGMLTAVAVFAAIIYRSIPLEIRSKL
jgi:MFS family permease